MNKKKVIVLLSIMLFIFLAPLVHAKKVQVNYRLKWLFNTSVAGDVIADVNGYFSDAGLMVRVKEGSPEKNAINEIELGRADFGVASADQVIRALEKGTRIIVIAQLFQVNPMQWIYRTDQSEIKVVQDLKGRRIGITFGGNDQSIMQSLLSKAGIKKNEVSITGVRFDFTPFLRKKVDVWPVYRNSQGVILQDKLAKEGEGVYFFNPADFGINFVANSVITSEKTVKTHPDLVENFLTALLKGWEAAMNPVNEEIVLNALKKVDGGNNDDIRRKQLIATRALIKPSESVRIGTIDVNGWKQTEEIMIRLGQIKKAVHVDRRLRN
jgi:NitT/TauT family transport system substrate-binding protein